MSKKVKKINIPLSKILIICFLIFVAFHFVKNGKNKENLSENKTKITNSSKKESSVKISPLSFNDVVKSLEQNPPKLNQCRDTVKWQKGVIIRHFSIDTTLQKKTRALVSRAKVKYGAAVALNPETGQILAMVSQTDAEQQKIAENLCLSSKFPAASIFKTVTAEAAFENTEITCTTKINFVGRNTTLYKNQFFPEDFGEKSNSVEFLEAYAKSINPIFGWLAIHEIGREKLYKSAQKFGWNTKIPFEMSCDVSVFPETNAQNVKDTINIAEIGSGFNNETTLTPLLGGLIASTVINKGNMMAPTIIDSITDKSGKKLYAANTRKWKRCTAYDIADSLKFLMQQTTKIGSARMAFAEARKTLPRSNNIISGGKTGTKDSELGRNEWFTGFAQDTLNDVSIVTSVCLVQYPMFILRPSQISADIMFDYLLRKNKETE
ncbi:MAG: penicillin-binding transpeptidase domain-containing protein [Chitinivibrionia bacterium]|nr:penicillin-binding transpeptidase domain-containing protein [Chitinivibrionia bacterium]